jgi:hypothetical protein
MKVIIQLGETRFRLDDGMGSETPFEAAVDYISDLMKSVFPEMDGMRLISVDDEMAAEIFKMGECDHCGHGYGSEDSSEDSDEGDGAKPQNIGPSLGKN